MDKDKKQHQIKIELDDNVGQGEYVNFAIVTHSPAEFVMDYIRVLPGMAKSKVKSRIIMAPMHAKTLMMALQDNIKKYESKFGEIKIAKGTAPNPSIKLPDDVLPNQLVLSIEFQVVRIIKPQLYPNIKPHSTSAGQCTPIYILENITIIDRLQKIAENLLQVEENIVANRAVFAAWFDGNDIFGPRGLTK